MGFIIKGGGGSGGSGGTTDHNALVNKDLPNQHSIDAITGLLDELGKRPQTTDVNTMINSIVDGAPEAYDTLKEIADYIAQDQSAGASILSALGNKVDKEAGKGLSSNDYDNTAKNKVDNLNITQVVDLDAVKNASHTHANTSVLGKIGEDSKGKATYNNELIFKNDANQINNTPAGNVTASNVQAAINELDNKKAPAGYGLGGTTPSITSTDINTLLGCGFYYCNTTCTNTPDTSKNWHVVVYGVTSTKQFAVQMATELSSRDTYIRVCNAGTWSDWRQIATTVSPTLTGIVTLGGGQLKFPATQNASTDPNTLDDYEEGTWTPTLYGGTTAGSYTLSSINAQYTKIGNIVHVFGFFSIAIASAGAGAVVIGGLPFTKAANTNAVGSVMIAGFSLTERFSIGFTNLATSVNTLGVFTDVGVSPVPITSISAGNVHFSITYKV